MHVLSTEDSCRDPAGREFLAASGGGAAARLGASEFWASGRDALRSVSETLRGFRRIFLPRYVCPSMPIFLGSFAGLERYDDGPLMPEPRFDGARPEPGDCVFIVNYFGAKGGAFWAGWREANSGVFTVEDHTFAPFSTWASESGADIVFGSLRKALPVPDGAFLRRKGVAPRPLARRPSVSMPDFAAQILAGMNLRSLLKGTECESYRRLFLKGEQRLFLKKNAERMSLYSHEILSRLDLEKFMAARAAAVSGFFSSARAAALPQFTPLRPVETFAAFEPLMAFERRGDMDLARKILFKRHARPALFWP